MLQWFYRTLDRFHTAFLEADRWKLDRKSVV